jgi:hypothetical protein
MEVNLADVTSLACRARTGAREPETAEIRYLGEKMPTEQILREEITLISLISGAASAYRGDVEGEAAH